MSGTFDLLAAACRVWLGTAPPGLAVDAAIDDAELEELAFLHNLEPLLHRLDERGDVDAVAVPAALRARWEKAYYQNHVFNTEALGLLGRLDRAFARAGLTAVVFKGPATLARGYGDPALRPMIDLDLLCREGDLGDLVRVAGEHGFTGGEESSIYHVALQHPEQGLGLELHFDLYDFLPRRAELLDRLFTGSVRLELAGHGFRALEPAQAMVMDVAHLVHHDFRLGLKPLLDLAAQVGRAVSPPPGEAVAREAARFGLEPELALAGALVEGLLAVRLPATAGARQAGAGGDLARLEAALRRPSAARPALEWVTARGGWGGRARYLWRLLFPPAERLALASRDPGSGRLALRWRHLAARLRSARGRRRSWGVAGAAGAADSIRQRVYERRAR